MTLGPRHTYAGGRRAPHRLLILVAIMVTIVQVGLAATPSASAAGGLGLGVLPSNVVVIAPEDVRRPDLIPQSMEPPPGYNLEVAAAAITEIGGSEVASLLDRVERSDLGSPAWRVVVPAPSFVLVTDLYRLPTETHVVETLVGRDTFETVPIVEAVTSIRADGSLLSTVHAPSLAHPSNQMRPAPDLPPLALMTPREEDRLQTSVATDYQPSTTVASVAATCSTECVVEGVAVGAVGIYVCTAAPGALALVGLVSGWGALTFGLLCSFAFLGGGAIYGVTCGNQCSNPNPTSVPRIWLYPNEMGCTYTYCDPKLHVDFKGRTIEATYTDTRINWSKSYPYLSGFYTQAYESSYGYPWSPLYNHADGSQYMNAHLDTPYPRWVECTSGIDLKVYFPYTDGSYSQMYVYAAALGAPTPLVKPRFPYCATNG